MYSASGTVSESSYIDFTLVQEFLRKAAVLDPEMAQSHAVKIHDREPQE